MPRDLPSSYLYEAAGEGHNNRYMHTCPRCGRVFLGRVPWGGWCQCWRILGTPIGEMNRQDGGGIRITWKLQKENRFAPEPPAPETIEVSWKDCCFLSSHLKFEAIPNSSDFIILLPKQVDFKAGTWFNTRCWPYPVLTGNYRGSLCVSVDGMSPGRGFWEKVGGCEQTTYGNTASIPDTVGGGSKIFLSREQGYSWLWLNELEPNQFDQTAYSGQFSNQFENPDFRPVKQVEEAEGEHESYSFNAPCGAWVLITPYYMESTRAYDTCRDPWCSFCSGFGDDASLMRWKLEQLRVKPSA